ncbi:MAG: hypothetical protein IKI67_08180, partial [Bacteroidales bacterium]|nr:hypothetical protein [Bacteroidales bacterium]
GSPISGVALDKTNPTSFTLLSLPRDITRLKLVLDLTIDGTAKQRTLDLKKKNGDWVTLSKGRKLLISSMNIADIGYEIVTPGDIVIENGITAKSKNFEIESYKIDRTSGVKTKLDITKIEYSAANPDGTNKEDWSTTPPSGITSAVSLTNTAGTTYSGTVNVSANSSTSSDNRANRTAHLASRDNGKTSSSPEDLSLMEIDGTERFPQLPVTANSYVIRKKGWYAFPVVYGNAIDGLKGSTIDGIPYNNKDAYAPNYGSGNRYLSPFRNALNNDITNPYIHKDMNINSTGESADLLNDFEMIIVWVDVPSGQNFISDLELISSFSGAALNDVPYARFRINENIQEGNAVLALRKKANNMIVWSWHIWISDYDMQPVTVYYNKNLHDPVPTQPLEMLPYALGLNLESENWLNERVWYMRLTQDVSNEQKIVKIVQTIDIQSLEMNAPYFYGGRKDPFLPASLSASSVNKNHHSPSGYTIQGSSASSLNFYQHGAYGANAFYGLAIQRPYQVLFNPMESPQYGTYNWVGGYYAYDKINLWNAQQTVIAGANGDMAGVDIPVVKTIYDPCPPCYSIPRGFAFTFTGPSSYFATSGSYYRTYTNALYLTRNLYGKESFSNPTDYLNYFKGVMVYYDPNDKRLEKTIFFPMLGYRTLFSEIHYEGAGGGGGVSFMTSVRAYSANRNWTEGGIFSNNRMIGGIIVIPTWDPYYNAADNYMMGYVVYMTKN